MGHSQSQVDFAENGDNASLSEIESGGIEGWNTDSVAESYLPNIATRNGRDIAMFAKRWRKLI